jgi:hypothetical protein
MNLMRLAGLLLLLFLAVPASAHTVNLAWTVSTDDTTLNCAASGACHQTVYRAPGACSATSSFISLGVIAAMQGTFADTNVPGGIWCYAVTFTLDGTESAKDVATVSLQPQAPTSLKATGT